MMYYKIINDRMVFSQCFTIQNNEGLWISNPTEEMIAEAGWLPYTPPIVPPQPQMEPDYEQVIEAVKKILSTTTDELPDEEALEVAALYPTWSSKVDSEVVVGERLWYDGRLYRVIQAHTATELWVPDHNPALFAEISIEEFPEWKQPLGSEDAYHLGDKVRHNDKRWIANIDNNIWEPGVFGWDEI